jgi:hypothetical protein
MIVPLRENREEEQGEPRQVGEHGLEIQLQVGLLLHGFDPLPGAGEGYPEQRDGNHREQHHGQAKTLRLVAAAEDGFQRRHEGADDPCRSESTDEAVTGQAGPFHRVR